ncbi:amino acid ABC transporter ATP-binding/permease protein [Brachybacterium phenoliresistens]|uniref:amino acid ABC transporter ATP-binding/permease protein n=1 Tax=Brachybacterium phenoliresistens TaxID=396014 RepID=UPI0031D90407
MSTAPLARILPLLRIPRTRLLAAVIASAATLGAAFALAAVSAWLVTTAWTMPPVLDLTVAVVGVRALGVSRGVLRWADRMLTHDVALRGVVELRTGLFTRLASRPADAISRLRRGDLLARLGDDAQEMADHVITAVVPAAVAAVMALAVLATIGPLSLLAAGTMLLSLLIATCLAPWAAHRAAGATQAAVLETRSAVVSAALEILDDATALRVAGRLDAAEADLAAAQRDHDRAVDRAAWPAAIAAAAVPLAMIPAVLGSLLAAGAVWLEGAASAGAIGILLLLPLSSFEAATALPAAAAQRARSRAAAARLVEAIGPQDADAARTPAAEPGAGRDAGTDAAAAGRAVPALRARGLDAGWSAEGRGVRGLDLELAPGTRLAITGASGIGKSTLLMTLAGLLEPLRGSVALEPARPGPESGPVAGPTDGPTAGPTAGPVAAAAHRPDPHDGEVILFAEDAHVFATTVRENLRVARGQVTDAEIRQALAEVGLEDWVDALPAGLGTMLGPDGTTVSGGERRRLLLARALVRGAPISLLDEPTEHLDAARGDALLTRLLDPGAPGGPLLPREHTVVVVTHRRDRIPPGAAVLDLEPDGRWTLTPGRPGGDA